MIINKNRRQLRLDQPSRYQLPSNMYRPKCHYFELFYKHLRTVDKMFVIYFLTLGKNITKVRPKNFLGLPLLFFN